MLPGTLRVLTYGGQDQEALRARGQRLYTAADLAGEGEGGEGGGDAS